MLRKIMLLGIFLIMLSACSSNTFTFNGETNNWSASFKVTQHSNDYEDQELKLEYKGDDVSAVGDITFEVNTNAGGFSRSGNTLSENGLLIIDNQANPTNAKIMENSEVEVTVEWNDNTETIILTNDY
ncbi:hypothetical protein [Oceanobacillus saliphilus]|uniref:hypothetical protein n=1 Tax=Oceanobacillus saliphilus TaxID=2925834 RepID=UPI00201DFBE0|nr:hypothetical protein [Oceanobacillus saliphilus]